MGFLARVVEANLFLVRSTRPFALPCRGVRTRFRADGHGDGERKNAPTAAPLALSGRGVEGACPMQRRHKATRAARHDRSETASFLSQLPLLRWRRAAIVGVG